MSSKAGLPVPAALLAAPVSGFQGTLRIIGEVPAAFLAALAPASEARYGSSLKSYRGWCSQRWLLPPLVFVTLTEARVPDTHVSNQCPAFLFVTGHHHPFPPSAVLHAGDGPRLRFGRSGVRAASGRRVRVDVADDTPDGGPEEE
jgi:hypothetical protein